MSTEQNIKVAKNINIVSYAFFVPTLILWTCVLIRILIQSERKQFLPLIVICVLMIVSLIALIEFWQEDYTIWVRFSEGIHAEKIKELFWVN